YPGDPTERMNELMLEAGKYPSLRLFHVRPEAASEPKDDCDGMGGWQVSSAHSVPGFTATGYIFGRKLCETLNVPVGMIQSDWGGTRIEAWMTVSAARKVLPNILESDPVYDEQNRTARLYNAMICPLTNFTARGFLYIRARRTAVSTAMRATCRSLRRFGADGGAMPRCLSISYSSLPIPMTMPRAFRCR
ncbi:MAG: hypothetical protein ACLTTP_11100, partial [Alistipes ihumii]